MRSLLGHCEGEFSSSRSSTHVASGSPFRHFRVQPSIQISPKNFISPKRTIRKKINSKCKMDPTKCNLKVNSSRVQYTDEAIETLYDYATSSVTEDADSGTFFVSLGIDLEF